MADEIFGDVAAIVDGDTIDLDNVSTRASNAHPYRRKERVRLLTRNAPELGSRGGTAAKTKLSGALAGRRVRVRVATRDTYGRVVGRVTVE